MFAPRVYGPESLARPLVSDQALRLEKIALKRELDRQFVNYTLATTIDYGGAKKAVGWRTLAWGNFTQVCMKTAFYPVNLLSFPCLSSKLFLTF